MEKARFLEQPWSPPSDFEWPYAAMDTGRVEILRLAGQAG